jgi:hypothetical protein
VGKHLATFDQIKNSGYYQTGMQHIFVDNIVSVQSKKVKLNEEAQEYIWAPAHEALQYLDIEPNARHTVELYAKEMSKLMTRYKKHSLRSAGPTQTYSMLLIVIPRPRRR